jgi:hypothetical protein
MVMARIVAARWHTIPQDLEVFDMRYIDEMGMLHTMELNPALDVHNRTALLAVDLIKSLFGHGMLMRK